MNMKVIACLFFCLILCSCTSIFEFFEEGFYFDEEKFKSEWNLWKKQDIKNYSFTLKGKLPHWDYAKAKDYYGAILMFGYEVEIIVKNGIMDSFEYIGKTPSSEPEYTSISDMYQKIYDDIKSCERYWKKTSDKGCLLSKHYKIKYDPKHHYITYYEPITNTRSGCILDTDEHEVTVSAFSTL
ncbi:MAG: hypothetical protein LBC75_10240 [Fibromonadaceae bacterium]|jgi:hypothetical protein|nr:hypothetical protein [Fibromonadaceae bacterium]